jgi:hypothetical protein
MMTLMALCAHAAAAPPSPIAPPPFPPFPLSLAPAKNTEWNSPSTELFRALLPSHMASALAPSVAAADDASKLLAADGALFNYKFLVQMYLIGIATFFILLQTHFDEG